VKTILITGPIGSGKSEVCRYLRSLGKRVYDCDSRCKALYEEVPGLKAQIERTLGIPFEKLKEIFTDDAKREALEALVYPILIEDFKAWRAKTDEDCYIESAIAASKPQFDGLYDEIWLVSAPLETRIARNPKAATRDSLQNFDGMQPSKIIVNDSTLDNLYKQII